MNCYVKNLILYQANFYKVLVCGKNSMFYLLIFINLQNNLNQSIQKAKQNYFNKVGENLSDPSTSTKCYLSLLKIPCIPHIFDHDKYTVDFKVKEWNLEHFFGEQCSLIPNKIVLLSPLALLTENSLANCHFFKKNIF